MRSPHTKMKSSPHSLQLAKASSKEDPVQSKEINLKKKKKDYRILKSNCYIDAEIFWDPFIA